MAPRRGRTKPTGRPPPSLPRTTATLADYIDQLTEEVQQQQRGNASWSAVTATDASSATEDRLAEQQQDRGGVSINMANENDPTPAQAWAGQSQAQPTSATAAAAVQPVVRLPPTVPVPQAALTTTLDSVVEPALGTSQIVGSHLLISGLGHLAQAGPAAAAPRPVPEQVTSTPRTLPRLPAFNNTQAAAGPSREAAPPPRAAPTGPRNQLPYKPPRKLPLPNAMMTTGRVPSGGGVPLRGPIGVAGSAFFHQPNVRPKIPLPVVTESSRSPSPIPRPSRSSTTANITPATNPQQNYPVPLPVPAPAGLHHRPSLVSAPSLTKPNGLLALLNIASKPNHQPGTQQSSASSGSKASLAQNRDIEINIGLGDEDLVPEILISDLSSTSTSAPSALELTQRLALAAQNAPPLPAAQLQTLQSILASVYASTGATSGSTLASSSPYQTQPNQSHQSQIIPPWQQAALHANNQNSQFPTQGFDMSDSSSTSYQTAHTSFSNPQNQDGITQHQMQRQSRFAADMALHTTTEIPDPNANPTAPLRGLPPQGQTSMYPNNIGKKNQQHSGIGSQGQVNPHAHPLPGSYRGQTNAAQAQKNLEKRLLAAHQFGNPMANIQGPAMPLGLITRPVSTASSSAAQSNITANPLIRSSAPQFPPGLRIRSPAEASTPSILPPGQSNVRTPRPSPSPLPTGLRKALAAAGRTVALPSVLEPTTPVVEISYCDAVTYLLSTLPGPEAREAISTGEYFFQDRAVDVTFYDPNGTYLIPVRELVLNNNTTLSMMVLQLQELLNQNIHDLVRMGSHTVATGQFIVHSIQIRMFADPVFLSFPQVCGELFGSTQPNQTNAQYVDWPCNHGIVELYWETYRRVAQMNATSNDVRSLGKPMFKVRTVLKIPTSLDHLMASGGHVFITAPYTDPFRAAKHNLPGPTKASEPIQHDQPSTVKGKSLQERLAGLSTEDQKLLDVVNATHGGKTNASDVSKEELVNSLKMAMNDGKPEVTNEDRQVATMVEHFKYLTTKYGGVAGDFPKVAGAPGLDPKKNWTLYGKTLGHPDLFEIFDMSKLNEPFEKDDFPPPHFFDHLHDPSTIPKKEDMLSYSAIDPQVHSVAPHSPKLNKKMKKYYDRHERAVTFDYDDDDTYFPESSERGEAKFSSPPPTPLEPLKSAERKLRLNAAALLSSVNTRKGIDPATNYPGMDPSIMPQYLNQQPSLLSGENNYNAGNTSYGESSNVTTGLYNNGGSSMGGNSVNHNIGGGSSNSGNHPGGNPFLANNHMGSQVSNTGFYSMSAMTAQNQHSGYANMLNAANNQAASYYDTQPHNSTMSHQAYSTNIPMAPHAGTRNFKLRGPNRQSTVASIGSLSAYNDMLQAKNPNMGTLSSFSGSINVSGGNAAVNGLTTGQSTAGNQSLAIGRGHVNSRPHQQRARVASQLRPDTPSFKMSTTNSRRAPVGSPSARLGSGLATNMMQMAVDDAGEQTSESGPPFSAEQA